MSAIVDVIRTKNGLPPWTHATDTN
jgi:hypothetical protein